MICTPIIGLLRIKSDFATLKSSDGLATLYRFLIIHVLIVEINKGV